MALLSILQPKPMSASLIGRLGSSAFQAFHEVNVTHGARASKPAAQRFSATKGNKVEKQAQHFRKCQM
jgi:hypothetical protein